MKIKLYMRCFIAFFAFMLMGMSVISQTTTVPIITGPVDSFSQLPATLNGNSITGQVYTVQLQTTDAAGNILSTVNAIGTNFVWVVSAAGKITSPIDPTVSNTIKVDWTAPNGQQSVSVNYTDAALGPQSAFLIINWNPFLAPIDGASVPHFIDPLPHFAAGLRVNARAGGQMTVTTKLIPQVALSTGTLLKSGTVGTKGVGVGNYAGYEITYNGITYPAMWPARTIEAGVGNQLDVTYVNGLYGVKYSDFNILADQTLLLNKYPQNGNIQTDPYTGPIPMVVHLHGGEMPSNSDGGPTAWFMPGNKITGPGFDQTTNSLSTYPNKQEEGTLWYHPHDQGLTRINVYTGLAGYYFLRGPAEEAAKLPGWSKDDLVKEVAPTPSQKTFAAIPYLPEIELGIQDRMFNTDGGLFWPVQPTNPDIHPFWTPEFFGDVMVVNGKSWPYLSVAPRKYRFRVLDGCNARFLNLWLANAAGAPGPAISVIGSDGNMLDKPAILDPNSGINNTLLMAPGERYDVIIDFTGLTGSVFTLMNNAAAPFPTGTPADPTTTGKIMQFVVNGNMVAATTGTPSDKSLTLTANTNLRTANPMVKLVDFNTGLLTTGVTANVTRQIILNEVTAAGGPAQVLFNNSHFDANSPIPGAPKDFGGPTELPVEGTTELIQIINTTVDGHPIHIHLMQWQLVSRQNFDVAGYMAEYNNQWHLQQPSIPIWPVGLGYPGGSGSPYPYNTINADGAVGGNPALVHGTKNFLIGNPIFANPEERVWKDDIKAFPGQVATYIVRAAPTSVPIAATPAQLMFPFDPSVGPGYVWHCHIIDHEDMDMMRPLLIQPSPERFPKITVKPSPTAVCDGTTAVFSVTATSATKITYKWQVSTDAGLTWTNLADAPPYSGTATRMLNISPAILSLTTYQYRALLTNIDGVTTSNGALLTVNPLPTPTFTSSPDNTACRLAISAYETQSGQSKYVWTIPGRKGIDYLLISGGTSTSNKLNLIWLSLGSKTVGVNYTNANGCTAVLPATVTTKVVQLLPPMPGDFTVSSNRVVQGQLNVRYTVPLIADATYNWKYLGNGATITGNSNSVQISFTSTATSGFLAVSVSNGCGTSLPRLLMIIVDKNKLKSADIIADPVAIDESINKSELKAFPNPTSGAVNFAFRINQDARVTLDITSIIGTQVARVFDKDVLATEPQTVVFDKGIPAGIYFYSLKWNDQTMTGKFIKTE